MSAPNRTTFFASWHPLIADVFRGVPLVVFAPLIALGRISLASAHGGIVAGLVVIASWIAASMWFDGIYYGMTRPGSWACAMIEPIVVLVCLRYVAHFSGVRDRWWRMWLVIGGVTTWVWLFSAIALAIGGQSFFGVIGWLNPTASAWLIGLVLRAGFGRSLQHPWFTAFSLQVLAGFAAFVMRLLLEGLA